MRAAAKALGVGAPAVSLQLKALEEKLGVDLLIRTTRSVELTEAGKTLFDSAAPAYRDMTDAIRKTQETAKSTSGTLRLSLSRGAYVTALEPVLNRFQSENPGISLDLSWNEGLVDIIRDGFHAGIRLGDVLATDMVAVRLTQPLPSAFTASPRYLEKHGQPQHPRDLFNHHCIRYRYPTSKKIFDWVFVEDGQEKIIDPPTRLVFDNMMGVIQAARDGAGIGWSLRATAQDYLDSGKLVSVLDSYSRTMPPFYLYYPEQNKRIETLRLFIDCLVSHRDYIARSE